MGATLGTGGFSTVVKVIQHATHNTCAIKIIMRSGLSDKFWYREIDIMKLIQHPHIVRLIETIESGKRIYIAMKLIEGGNLRQFLERDGVMSERQAGQASWDICGAVQYLHDHGIAHRDLKAENVLISSTMPLVVKVANFGLAKSFVDGTFLHSICGTPNSMAPEVWLKVEESQYGCLVDSWGMGVMLFMMFSLDTPFELVDNDIESYTQFVQSRRIQWEHLRIDAGWLVRDLILRFLVIDPDARLAFDKAMTHPWFTYLGLSRRQSMLSMSSEAEVEKMLLCGLDIEVDVS
ncbi:kinase-like protein [Suillus hirtellus]|nr:kinase-like protein [Suillus hirtellus]